MGICQFIRLMLVLVLLGGIAGCSTTPTEPLGVGTGRNDLKESPCACVRLKQHWEA